MARGATKRGRPMQHVCAEQQQTISPAHWGGEPAPPENHRQPRFVNRLPTHSATRESPAHAPEFEKPTALQHTLRAWPQAQRKGHKPVVPGLFNSGWLNVTRTFECLRANSRDRGHSARFESKLCGVRRESRQIDGGGDSVGGHTYRNSDKRKSRWWLA